MVVLAHPTGNTFVRAAARALHGADRLHAFYTTIAAPGSRVLSCLPRRLRRQVVRRRFAEVPAALVRTDPWRESVRLGASAFGVERLTRRGAWASIDAVYEHFDRHVAGELERRSTGDGVDAVYAYEDAADHTFRAARPLGVACVYELPIAYWATTQRLLQEEAERLPEWRPTLGGIDDSREKLDRKVREIERADVVVVPSQFVLETLPNTIRAAKPCLVAPFGSPAPYRRPLNANAEQPPPGRLRVLFAGAMTQRKGLGDLFTAMRLLDRSDVELVVMGSPVAPMAFYRQQYRDFVYEPPRPHDRVLALMQSCDLLVLPAIVEGRALVQQEALASGLPIVVTANAGGADLVDEGQTGFVIPIRSPEAIADRLGWFADHRDELPRMRSRALEQAGKTGWSHYESQILAAVSAATGRPEARVVDGVTGADRGPAGVGAQ